MSRNVTSDPADKAEKGGRWAWLKNAFSMDGFSEPITEEEVALLDRVAALVSRKGMTVPAILFLETVHPLNYIGSQAMAFFEPLVKTVFKGADYTAFRKILERRIGIETLIQRIEAQESQKGDDAAPPADSNDVPVDEKPDSAIETEEK